MFGKILRVNPNGTIPSDNPFYNSANANLLSLIPFLVLIVLLYLAGREVILAGRDKEVKT